MSQAHSEPGAPKAKGFAGLSSLVGYAGAGDAAQPELPSVARPSAAPEVPAPDVPVPAAAESVIGSKVSLNELVELDVAPESQPQPQQAQQTSSLPIKEPGKGMLYVGIILVSVVAIFFAGRSNSPSSQGNSVSAPSYSKAPEFPPLPSEQINSQAIKELPASAAIDFNPSNLPSSSIYPPSTDNIYENQPAMVAGQLLSPAQLRYCVAQGFRIDGARAALDNRDMVSVALFNIAVEDLNARCGDFQYRPGTLERAQEVMAPHRAKFEQEGKALLK